MSVYETLEDVRRAGYCTDEWRTWQQGKCGTYALALIGACPWLRLAVAGWDDDDGWSVAHFYAHDDRYAYDSAGRHPLPYRGIDGSMDHVELDTVASWWGLPEEEGTGEAELQAALDHARRNGILALAESGQLAE